MRPRRRRRRSCRPIRRMIPAPPAPPRAVPRPNRSSSSSPRRVRSRASRMHPRPQPRRSPRREPGAVAQAGSEHGRTGRRRPALAARSPDRAAEASEVGGHLAPARVRCLVLLVATDLPFHDAARVRRAARRGEGAAFREQRGAVHHLSEGRSLRRTVRGLALHLLADLALRGAGAVPARAKEDRAVRARGDAVLRRRRHFLLPRHPAAGRTRSEEHTSELQSLAYLVCRLLLEKKKNTI